MIWISLGFLGLLAFDIWGFRKTKHKTRSKIFMAIEGLAAVGFFLQWLIK